MWAILSDSGHSKEFADDGPRYAPMVELLANLAQQNYANELYGMRSMDTFGITTAPSYAKRNGHDSVRVQYAPSTELFYVNYDQWISATRNPSHGRSCTRSCEPLEVQDIIALYVLRLVMSKR